MYFHRCQLLVHQPSIIQLHHVGQLKIAIYKKKQIENFNWGCEKYGDVYEEDQVEENAFKKREKVFTFMVNNATFIAVTSAQRN